MKKTEERFDINAVSVAGVVQRLWGRGGDVFARLRVSTRGKLEEDDDAFSTYVNLRFPGGGVQGNPVSLSPGLPVSVRGFLTRTRYNERILKYLDAANARDFLAGVPEEDREAWMNIYFSRKSAMLNVTGLRLIGADTFLGDEITDVSPRNDVILEGNVAKLWEYPYDKGVHLFLRVACYDRNTRTLSTRNKFGFPVRVPHYLNVKIPDGQVSGIPVHLSRKIRIRVTGKIAAIDASTTLREELLDTGSEAVIALMGRLPNADKLEAISAQRTSLHIEAAALIVYSAARKGLKG